MSYSKHTWHTKEPITQAKMQNIEDGIDAIDTQQSTNTSNINTLQSIVGYESNEASVSQSTSVKHRINGLSNRIQLIENTGVGNLSTRLTDVENQVNWARGDTEPRPNLAQVLADMKAETSRVDSAYKSADTVLNGRIDTAQSTADTAIGAINAAKGTSDTLAQRIDAIETKNRTQDTEIDNLQDVLNQPIAGDDRNVAQHISSLHNEVDDISSEIETARGLDNLNVARANLNARFVDDETRIGSAESRLTSLETATSTTIPNRISNVEGRATALESEVNAAHNSTANDETYASLDARFEAVESKVNAAAVASTVNESLTSLDTRLDAIDGGTTFDNTNGTLAAHVNAIETAIDYTPVDQNDETPAGLTQRITAVEITVGDNSAGLVKRVSDAETTIGSIEDNIGNGFDSTNTIAAAINSKANSDDVSTALNLKADKSTVNTISTTIVLAKTAVNFDANNVPTTLVSGTINDKDDYLIQSPADDKYYYWKHINNEWHLMGGASSGEGGGTGNSNAEDYASYALFIAAEKELNKDYYVLQDDGFYHHYRYLATGVNDDPIEIGTVVDSNNIKQYKLEGYTDNETNKNYIDLYQFDYGISTSELSEGTRVSRIEIIGGGSGGGAYNTKQITRITPRNRKWPIGSDEKIYLQFFYTNGTANESDKFVLTQSNVTMSTTAIMGGGDETITSGDPANASSSWPTKQVEIDGEMVTVPKEQSECATGFYQFDITDYCKTLGKQTFVLTITDQDDASIYTTMTWEVTLINLTIESDFAQNTIVPLGQAINFTYTPSGDITKVAHFYLGNEEIGTQNLAARAVDEQTYTITGKNVEGAYQLRVYLSAQDNGNNIYSESIYRDLIWRNSDSETLIISSPYRGRTVNVQQYSAVEIPYTIAGNSNTYTVKYYVNDFNSSYNEIVLNNTNSGKWTYRPLEQGTQNLRIEVENTHIDITLNVIENVVDIAPYTTNLVLNFDPTGLSNNSNSARNWTDGIYHLTTSNNFDWFNGGYKSDETGDYFLIKSGTRAYFDYKMFEQEMEQVESQDNSIIEVPTSKVYRTGQEMKIIFKTSAVRAIDAVWFTNTGKYDAAVDTQVGIQLSVHEGWLKTDSASDEAVGSGDEQVAATNTYLYFPYSEEDRIELDININKETADNAFAMSYEDGVPSKAYAYTHSQKLYHIPNNESIITIGSDDCDVYLYKLKIYNSDLTPAQVLRNFIADGKTVDESIERYQRNCIYYDVEHNVYSPYATSGFELNPEALASKIPNVKVLMLDTPSFTLNKKSFIKDSSLRCIHAPGGTLYPSRGVADNWLFEHGYHAGQGTTSDKYGDAGRNVDFLFNCDGTHKPSDKVNPIEGYISQVTTGYGTENAETSVVSDWKGTSGKISLTETSVPNNFFNFKVNIASSENVNNALLQKRYNDFLPYVSPASAAQIAKYGAAYHTDYGLDLSKLKVKNDMEFVPAVLFVRENGTGEVVHSEFGDTNWHFYALGNLGDSKKTDYTRAYDPDDINEFTLEISDNNTNNSQFQTGVYLVNGVPTLETFEPEQDVDDKGKIVEGSFTAVGTSGAIAPTDYVYPLDTPELKAMWNATDPQTGEYTNKNHWSLVNEKYDGDHSFEMRYACCGDYRDGKKVNDTTGQADTQLLKNSKVWQAFYSWVVTASNSEFVNNLDQWCVRSAVEFWYAFTHYYTMMDNRAKNTFWHFAKTGKYRRVSDPIADMLHVYEVSNDATLVAGTTNEWTGTFTLTEDNSIVSGHVYYTQYAFDLWDYDNDTALGIDNNGELIFPYGKEDDDYRLGNDPASGFVFNGAGSIFWRRLRDLCTNEIGNIFNSVSEQFFSAENLIKQFDDFQECYPEALWQVDIQRKYIRPFTNDKGKTLPNGSTEFLTRQSKRFLESMMQGRKKYQRRQWIKDQYYYFGSKYKLNNITEDFFYLDCYTGPDDALIAELKSQGRDEEAAQYVGSNWDLTITPYQDMYINASFGETAKSPVRAKAGEPVEMTCPFTSMSNTRIYIYGASRLKALAGKPIKDGQDNIIGAEGLASLYVGVNSIERTDKLQQLYFGTDKTTYRNANFTKLTLNENSPILEVLDIRNCGNLAGELKLGGCNNLTTLEAEGTNISLITLPSSSQITTLHLPSTITSLSLSSARKLTSFYMKNKSTSLEDYSNLRSLIIDNSDEHSTINWMTIAKTCINNLNYLYLLNLKTSSIGNINELEQFKVRKENITNVNLTGILSINGDWSTIEKTTYESTWPGLTFNVIESNKVNKTKVTYKTRAYLDDNGDWIPEEEIATNYITENQAIPDIYAGVAIANLPQRDSTIAYTYQFGSINQGQYRVYSGWTLDRNGNNPVSLYSQGYTSNNPYRATASQSEVTFYTFFNTSEHKYTVNWYLNRPNADSQELVKSVTNQKYGHGYDLQAPTVEQIRTGDSNNSIPGYDTVEVTFNNDNTVTYSIFDGWQKLPTNISPTIAEAQTSTYNIYGKWYTNTISIDDAAANNLFSDTTSPSLEQLLVFSRMNSTNRNTHTNSQTIVQNKKFNYQMGFSGTNNNGTVLVNTNAVRTFNEDTVGNYTVFNDIKPFNTNNGFTLAVDYQFDSVQPSATNGTVLLGCYDKVNGSVTGFALYNNLNSNYGSTGPTVGYGNMFSIDDNKRTVGPLGSRTMIVIRHPANSSQLWVYSSRNSNSNSLDSTINIPEQAIELSTQTLSSNAVLCLGNLRSDLSTNSTFINEYNNLTGAYGTIYWAKYWDEDLGEGECEQLANWPHENMTAIITAIGEDMTQTINGNIRPSIYLTGLNGSSHGTVQTNRFSTTNTGWDTSLAKDICDNRIFYGLPIRLQSILSNIRIGHKNYTVTVNEFNEYSYSLSDLYTSLGYVYLPSISSLDENKTGIDANSYGYESLYERNGRTSGGTLITDITPYSWYDDTASMKVYDYYATGTRWREASVNNNYYNLRFINKPITWSTSSPMNIYRISRSSISSGTTLRDLIPSLQIGDIVVLNDEAAYMYISIDDLNSGLQIEPQTDIFNTTIGGNTEGGWIKSQSYVTRSVSASSGQYNNFIFINALGSTIIPDNSNSQPGLVNLNYAFTI